MLDPAMIAQLAGEAKKLASTPFTVAGTVGGFLSSLKTNKKLQELQGQDPTYQANPLAKQRLGLAQTMLNARAPGAAYQEANIYGNEANTLNTVQRNATSGNQVLATAAAVEGQANQAFGQMGEQDAQDYQRRLGNLNTATEGQINEDDKVYQDRLRQYANKVQMQGAQNANTQNMWKSLANFGAAGGI